MNRAALRRQMVALACAVAIAFLPAACASMRFGGAAALKVVANVPEAALYIDDVYVGPVSQWSEDGRFVQPGFHRVELRHPDHFTHHQELELTRGDAVLMEVELRPLLD